MKQTGLKGFQAVLVTEVMGAGKTILRGPFWCGVSREASPSFLPSFGAFASRDFLSSFLLELKESGTLFLFFPSAILQCIVQVIHNPDLRYSPPRPNSPQIRRYYILWTQILIRIDFALDIFKPLYVIPRGVRKGSGATSLKYSTWVLSLRARSVYPTSPVADARAHTRGRKAIKSP
jgi:hypothetical protein